MFCFSWRVSAKEARPHFFLPEWSGVHAAAAGWGPMGPRGVQTLLWSQPLAPEWFLHDSAKIGKKLEPA